MAAALLLCLALAAPAAAQKYSNYQPNPDTAPNRQDNRIGTSGEDGAPKFGKDPVTGDDYMETTRRKETQDPPANNQTYDVDVIYPVPIKKKK